MLFGERLYKERKKNKLSAEQLSKACDVSRSYITLIENNKRLPGRNIIPKIAVALNLRTNIVINWYLEDIREKLQK
ncbi:MAG TPA: helix-turn-helix transcriptional regulator [Patescibacteria group bacterium]|nr:helix-turn-helix transcriptional regulator [Patescibacteria group bacterium]